MRRYYEYLQDPYGEDENGAATKREFLKKIDSFVNQKQYVRITLLNWDEEPLKEIQGELTSGTITKDGSSSVRRTCSLSASVGNGDYDIDDADYDFSINKKIFIEIGVKNYTDEYPQYPILWFPQGVFFISSAAVASSASSAVTINLTLKDKMCGLNGEVGGTFPAAVILDEEDTQDASGQYVTQKVLIYDIIKEMVNHYGGEDLNNIVIEDVPRRIKRVMKWTGSEPLYMTEEADGSWWNATLEKPDDDKSYYMFTNSYDVGYVYDDFVYDSELTANLGETVTSVLDKIKNYLGNFEYFYDEYGVFHFREIKNYLNTTQATTYINSMDKYDYLVDTTSGKTSYTFDDKVNIVSINATPQYNNIKNDFVIQGTKSGTSSSAAVDVRYHLVIDKKPLPLKTQEDGTKIYNEYFNILLYKEASTGLVKAIRPELVSSESALPEIGEFNTIYYISSAEVAKYWDDDKYKDVTIVKYYPIQAESATGYAVKDWRTELYMEGVLARKLGLDSSNYYTKIEDQTGVDKEIMQYAHNNRIDTDYYFEELDAFWPQIYDLENQRFQGEAEDKPLQAASLCDGVYYLDFIDSSTSGLGEFSVSNIGRRTDAVSSDDVNCLFQPVIPEVIFLLADDNDNLADEREECNKSGIPYCQVRSEIFYSLATGGYRNGAFDQVKYELYLHTTYQKSVSISSIPAFYLEPNTRVQLNDATTNTYGEYNISNISIPLGAGNTMTVSMSQAVERF